MSVDKLMDTECIICLELVNTQQLQKFEDCSHSNNFHTECIHTWINKCRDEDNIPGCPICRHDLIQDVKINGSYECGDNPHLAVGYCCFFASLKMLIYFIIQ